MLPIMAPGDRLFQAFLGDMSNFGDQSFTDLVAKVPRGSVRSMDYLTRHTLSNANPHSVQTVITRRKWIFIATKIAVSYTSDTPPLVKVSQGDMSYGNLSGGPSSASPLENPLTKGFISALCGFGPGFADPHIKILTEPRSFYRLFAESAIINCETRLAAPAGRDDVVNVLVSGWEVKLG